MTLTDMLDELARHMLRDRSDLMSGPDDYLWSDAQLVKYIDEAQGMLARKGLVIRDASTASVVEVTLAAGVTQYTLHPSIIAVISAKFSGDVGDLARAGHSAFNSFQRPDPLFIDPAQLSTMPPGKPLAFSTDEQLDAASGKSGVVSLRAYPEPSAEYDGRVITLRTVRKPLKVLSVDNLEASPEVPDDYHLGLLDWAAYRALRNMDSDAGAVEKADKYKTEFEAMVAQARTDSLRKLFAPLQWGFGRNGFSWEQ
jgi:hypothetical protein